MLLPMTIILSADVCLIHQEPGDGPFSMLEY